MLTYSFTNIGSDSLYHHLYQCIREDILCGNLTAETKLPSKRSFAKNLGVSNITVENAYAQLQAEGYIYSIPKKGFYVRNLSDLTLSISQTTSSTSNSLRMPDKYKVDLASNQMNPEQFPFSVWSKLIRETLLNRQPLSSVRIRMPRIVLLRLQRSFVKQPEKPVRRRVLCSASHCRPWKPQMHS